MGAELYRGSCACGKVRFEVSLELEQGTFKCNCTMCTKARFWGMAVQAETFKVVAGADDLTTYTGKNVSHHFCKHCGIKLFGKVFVQQPPMVSISIATLDGVDPMELCKAPLQYMDGLHDRWDREPAFTGHL
ncbi:MAG TPA: GFA family protein [bacterium]